MTENLIGRSPTGQVAIRYSVGTMRIGPFHVIRSRTYDRWSNLDRLWTQMVASRIAPTPEGRVAREVFEHSHGLLHSPLSPRPPIATVPPSEPDRAADLAAAARVVDAYRAAMRTSAEPPSPGLWHRLTRERQPFVSALEAGHVEEVASRLGRLFASDLIWGLGSFDQGHPALLASGTATHLHVVFADALVSLAEAVGAGRVTNLHQDPVAHLEALAAEPEAVYAETRRRLAFDPAFPCVGGAYGFKLGTDLVTIDSLVHAYTVHRLRQLGAAGSPIFEIGGGYGALALLADRAFAGEYAIFDLPWVNAIQGFFLIRALPSGAVCLFGEPTGRIRVLPYWCLMAERDGSCGTFVNTDSLAEIGEATVRAYLREIARVTRGSFLSINQEAMAPAADGERQNCVRALAEASGLVAVSRHRAWMRHGYVEDVFRARRDGP
jgi:hypothetical protein